MKKIIDISKVEGKITMIKKYGILVFGYFIIGYPGENRLDIKKTIDFAVKQDFDSVVFTCFMPLPGTPIYEELAAQKEIKKGVFGKNFFGIAYAPLGMSKLELKWWRLFAFFRFYTSSKQRFYRALHAYPVKKLINFIIQMLK